MFVCGCVCVCVCAYMYACDEDNMYREIINFTDYIGKVSDVSIHAHQAFLNSLFHCRSDEVFSWLSSSSV